jgi:hypothetical protein
MFSEAAFWGYSGSHSHYGFLGMQKKPKNFKGPNSGQNQQKYQPNSLIRTRANGRFQLLQVLLSPNQEQSQHNQVMYARAVLITLKKQAFFV